MEFSEAQAMCEVIPEILFVMETSAKENKNIEDIFHSLAAELKVSSGLTWYYRIGRDSPRKFYLFQRRHTAVNVELDTNPTITLSQGKTVNSCNGSCNLTWWKWLNRCDKFLRTSTSTYRKKLRNWLRTNTAEIEWVPVRIVMKGFGGHRIGTTDHSDRSFLLQCQITAQIAVFVN